MSILVIGAGPSGLHFALTALRKGQQVTLLNVGNSVEPPPLPNSNFIGLKQELPDPVEYFLGEDYDGAVLPPPPGTDSKEYYGLPPSKDPVFEQAARYSFTGDGFAPLHSFAAGGLAECWTGGSYALDEGDLEEFPFGYDEIAPYYSEVASRVGIAGAIDDLARHFPVHDNLASPIELDTSSALLLKKYESKRDQLHQRHAVRLGRSRQAALSTDLGDRKACTRCGRCLWGCPNGALYTPSYTLQECLQHPNFTYISGQFASHFDLSPQGSIERLVAFPTTGGAEVFHTADNYVLASGALSSSNLFLRTLWRDRGEAPKLPGLMDNRQILAPFLHLAMLGRSYDPQSYQYHQLALVTEAASSREFVHGQITTLTTAAAHPIIQQLPLDLRTARSVFQSLRPAIGVVNLNFSDWRREDNYLSLNPDSMDNYGWPTLTMRYRPETHEPIRLNTALRQIGRFMRNIGAPLIPGMKHIRPMGASVHYAGTLPMSQRPRELTVSPNGASHDIDNLFVVDGAVMPYLPAKNLTFTLMANAARVASKNF